MCLLIVLSRVVAGAPLVVAGNRDERLDRPAEAMAVLRASGPRTIGGRDLAAGGTWLAVNEHGVVAGLTNRPQLDGADPQKRSRGELPLALTSRPTVAEGVDAFLAGHDPADYNPAWLLAADRHSLFSIDLTGASATSRELPPGIHVLENRPLDESSQKLDHVRGLLSGIGALPIEQVVARLEVVMADHRRHSIPDDTIDDHREARLAATAACSHTDGYGTRWSGIVTVAAHPDARPAFRHTDGPPCTSPFADAATGWD